MAIKIDENFVALVEELKANAVGEEVFNVIRKLVVPKLKNNVIKLVFAKDFANFDQDTSNLRFLVVDNINELAEKYFASNIDERAWIEDIVTFEEINDDMTLYDVTEEYIKYVSQLNTLGLWEE